MEDKEYEVQKLCAKQVAGIIVEYFQNRGCEVDEVYAQVQHGLFIGVKLKIKIAKS